jgi:hypothetical protein
MITRPPERLAWFSRAGIWADFADGEWMDG